MRKDTGILKAGMAVVFSSGCYSDYAFGQVYVCAKDFNYMEEAKNFYFEKLEEEYKKDKDDWDICYVGIEDFESWLIRKGFLVLCENREVHLGDYSDFFDSDEWKEEFAKKKGIEYV